jgi:hypothetical protein
MRPSSNSCPLLTAAYRRPHATAVTSGCHTGSLKPRPSAPTPPATTSHSCGGAAASAASTAAAAVACTLLLQGCTRYPSTQPAPGQRLTRPPATADLQPRPALLHSAAAAEEEAVPAGSGGNWTQPLASTCQCCLPSRPPTQQSPWFELSRLPREDWWPQRCGSARSKPPAAAIWHPLPVCFSG